MHNGYEDNQGMSSAKLPANVIAGVTRVLTLRGTIKIIAGDDQNAVPQDSIPAHLDNYCARRCRLSRLSRLPTR